MTTTPPTSRDHGPQPLAALMAKHDLEPKHLVEASKAQLTFKAVTRALKGRQLTKNTMDKVMVALNRASGETYTPVDAFSYARKPRES